MKIKFNTLTTNKKEIEIKADAYKSAYYKIESAKTNGIKIDPKVFTSLDKIRIGTSKTKPNFTEANVTAFKELVKYADYVEVKIEDLYDYLAPKADNTADTPYKIKVINLPESITGAYNSSYITEGTIQYALVKNTNKYVDLVISNTVTSIGQSAFYGCTGLTSVTISDSVTSISVQTFCSCTSLTSVTIPDSVTSIGQSAFSGCTGLTSVTIPDSVTSIDNTAFSNCTGLTTINYTGTEEQWNAITKGSNWNYNVPSACTINYNY